jgi:carbamoyl-phosphate synthase large subunit
MKNKRIFVSGGAGVIGRSLVPMLVDLGAVVLVGDLEEIPEEFPSNITYRQGDLNDISQEELDMFDPEVFIHLAATFERSEETYGHWEENFHHNIKLSHHLISIIRNCPNLKRVVNASSYLIYDKSLYQFESPQNKPYKLKESDPINPRNLTGLSKLGHEIELEFLSKFKSDKFSSISARIYRGYGTNSRDIISRWIRALINKEEINIYNDEGFFDYMFARDTATGLIKLAETDISGIINLGTGKARQVKDVVGILLKYFPEMQYKRINKNDELIEASEADVSLLHSSLGWVPDSKLEETIPIIIEFEKQKIKSSKNSYGNVLITSSAAKVSLIEAVRSGTHKISKEIKIIGGDMSSNVISAYFVDEFWEMPRLDEINLDEFINECIHRKITVIIPTRDGELEFFSKNKDFFLSKGIYVMVSSKDVINKCIDKLEFSKQENLSIIPSSKTIKEIKSEKFVVKERYGAGSHSIGINLNSEDAITHSKNLTDPIYQPFISGKELSVDAYIDNKKNIKGIVMRERVLVVNGESQVTKTIIDQPLENSFFKIINSMNLSGHIILQAIIDEQSNIHVIECNPRFGGASAISIKSGLDSFYWLYLESRGEDIQRHKFMKINREIKQVRSHRDIYL